MIAQDVMHCASHGRIKMPKHLSLGMLIRHLTGLKQLITILNKIGDCISYDDVEVIDTSLAREVLARLELTAREWWFHQTSHPVALCRLQAIITTSMRKHWMGRMLLMPPHWFSSRKANLAQHLCAWSLQIIPKTKDRLNQQNGTFPCSSLVPMVSDLWQRYEGKVREEWFTFTNHPSSQMDLAWALVRMCPTKLFEVELNSVLTEEQKVSS